MHLPSGNEIKKELKDLAGLLVDMPPTHELTSKLMDGQKALKDYANRFLF